MSKIDDVHSSSAKASRAAGALIAFAGVAGFFVALLDLVNLREENLLLASAGAIALGLIFVAYSLAVRFKESQEVRLLDSQISLAESELEEALAQSARLDERFSAAGIERRGLSEN